MGVDLWTVDDFAFLNCRNTDSPNSRIIANAIAIWLVQILAFFVRYLTIIFDVARGAHQSHAAVRTSTGARDCFRSTRRAKRFVAQQPTVAMRFERHNVARRNPSRGLVCVIRNDQGSHDKSDGNRKRRRKSASSSAIGVGRHGRDRGMGRGISGRLDQNSDSGQRERQQ